MARSQDEFLAPIKKSDAPNRRRSEEDGEVKNFCKVIPWGGTQVKPFDPGDRNIPENELEAIKREQKRTKKGKILEPKEKRDPVVRKPYECSGKGCDEVLYFYPSQVTDADTVKCKKCKKAARAAV
jgi:hypothetical protein